MGRGRVGGLWGWVVDWEDAGVCDEIVFELVRLRTEDRDTKGPISRISDEFFRLISDTFRVDFGSISSGITKIWSLSS